MSFLSKAKDCVNEVLNRNANYQETLDALGEALLKSADRENRLEYLKGLAARQKAAYKQFRRSDPVNSLLKKSDYYRTMADIVALEQEIEEIDLAVANLNDEVKECYEPVADLEDPPEPAEAVTEDEEDVFADTDQPVHLGDTASYPPVDESAESEPDGKKPADSEPDEKS